MSRTAWAQGSPSNDLVKLAYKKFGEPTSEGEKEAFESFFKNVQEGKKADRTPDLRGVTQSTDVPRLLDPLYAGEWGDSRVIQADWINWLCEDSEASKKVTSRGIEIDEAKISGQVDLSWLKLKFPIRIFKCGFSDDIILDRASLRGLQMQTSCFRGIHGDGLNIDRDLSFTDHCLAQGVIWLQEATIGGSLNCDSSRFFGSTDDAINLQFAKIGAAVFFGKAFRSQGQVSLREASVGATIQCDGGEFISANPGGMALTLEGTKAGDVSLGNGFHAEGVVSLLRATIDGTVNCNGGQFINPNPGGMALTLEGAKVRDVSLSNGFHAEGEVSLLRATIDGSVDCGGGQFINPERMALGMEDAKTGDVLLRYGFHAEGEVSLLRATIDGSVDCEGGLFINPNPGGVALLLEGVKARTFLLRNGFRSEGAVSLRDAIGGGVDCDGGLFINPEGTALTLIDAKAGGVSLGSGFHAEGEVSLVRATIDGSVDCEGGLFINPERMALGMEDAKTGEVFLRYGFHAEGEVSLLRATIDGSVDCEGGLFCTSPGWMALEMEDAKTGDVILRNGFHAEGEVSLQSATVSGTLDCGGGEFINPRGSHGPLENTSEIALNLQAASTRTILLSNSFYAEGEVKLLQITIGGTLYCIGGKFINPVGTALDATGANIGGSVILENLEYEGLTTFEDAQVRDELSIKNIAWENLDLSYAKAKTLRNIESGWPPQEYLLLHGFTFDELHKDASPKADVQQGWVALQPQDAFSPQPFEEIAKVLRSMGHPDEADKVLVEKNQRYGRYVIAEDRREGNENKGFRDSLWYNWFGKLIGYGYYWWNAIYASLLVIVVGAVLFKIGYLTTFIIPTDKDAFLDGRLKPSYPRFNAFVYSLETFVPLVKLELEEYWIPDANGGRVLIWFDNFPFLTVGGLFRLYLWVHISLGWILTSVWVAGLTGLLKG